MCDPAVLTPALLTAQLAALPLPPGRDVLVHCSMRRIGWVPGGAATVAAALRDVIGAESCLVVPAQTPSGSTTSAVFRAATSGSDAAEVAAYERSLPGFDPRNSPSEGMGALAEYVRTRPGAARSSHPLASFAAWGPGAADLMAVHDRECHLGERSPLGTLYQRDASVLLLGVDYSACTAFHLAEHRLSTPPPTRRYRCAVRRDGRSVMVEFTGVDFYAGDFPAVGAAMDRAGLTSIGHVGGAPAVVVAMRTAVDFAAGWMDDHPGRAGLVS